MIIGDEAHLFKAVSLTKLMTKLRKCKYRVGLTGTLDGTKTHKLVLEGLFGNVNKVVSTSELTRERNNLQIKNYVFSITTRSNSSEFYERQNIPRRNGLFGVK